MKIGIYGGTFDPPHVGHINACKAFYDQIKLDKLFVIPAYLPPHKQLRSSVDANVRLEMCKLAFGSIAETIIISDLEIKRKGKSYTADTIRYFVESDKSNEIYFLCGTDMLITLDTWYKPEYILEHATIVHVKRKDGFDEQIEDAKKRLINNYNAKIVELDIDVIELSSTEIRNAVLNNKVNCDFLSKEVYDFIKKHKLYAEVL